MNVALRVELPFTSVKFTVRLYPRLANNLDIWVNCRKNEHLHLLAYFEHYVYIEFERIGITSVNELIFLRAFLGPERPSQADSLSRRDCPGSLCAC